MTIRAKLAWTATLMVLVVISVGGLFLWTNDVENVYRARLVAGAESLTELKELTSDVERQIARVDFFLVGRDPEELEIFRTLTKTNSRRLAQTPDIPWGAHYESMNQTALKVFETQGRQREAFSHTAGELRKMMAEYLESQAQLAQEQRDQTESRLKIVETASVLIAMAGVILAVVMNAYIYRSIVYPLQNLQEQVEALGRGDAQAFVKVQGKDELATVGRAFNAMVARLKELDQMKRDFTASVTHELRSPLSASQSFLNVLISDLEESKSGKNPTAQDLERWKTFIVRVRTNIERLNRFVSDLLDVAKIERGKLECRLERADLGPLIEETAEFFRERAKQKDVQLASAIEQGLPACRADLDRLRQVLVNLMDNAIKFTPAKGSVRVSALKEAGSFIKVSVQDSGPGIPPQYLPRLFGKFEQFKESYRYADGARGTGLGLAISKAIIDLHGGKIWASANGHGQGTIFSFTVPVA